MPGDEREDAAGVPKLPRVPVLDELRERAEEVRGRRAAELVLALAQGSAST
jgi:hypothetical protein